jgi:hypothetical protein
MSDPRQDLPPPSPSAPPSGAPSNPKWRRLTILDLLLLMVAYNLSGSWYVWRLGDGGANNAAAPQAKRLTGTEAFLEIVIGGNFLAAPFVLTTQFAFRRRRAWLGVGEWLWLAPLLLFALLGAAKWLSPYHAILLSVLVLLLVVLLICCALAVVVLGARMMGAWGLAPCRWTDVFGSLTCLSFGAMVFHSTVTQFA